MTEKELDFEELKGEKMPIKDIIADEIKETKIDQTEIKEPKISFYIKHQKELFFLFFLTCIANLIFFITLIFL